MMYPFPGNFPDQHVDTGEEDTEIPGNIVRGLRDLRMGVKRDADDEYCIRMIFRLKRQLNQCRFRIVLGDIKAELLDKEIVPLENAVVK
jgi:hypothetical protein